MLQWYLVFTCMCFKEVGVVLNKFGPFECTMELFSSSEKTKFVRLYVSLGKSDIELLDKSVHITRFLDQPTDSPRCCNKLSLFTSSTMGYNKVVWICYSRRTISIAFSYLSFHIATRLCSYCLPTIQVTISYIANHSHVRKWILGFPYEQRFVRSALFEHCFYTLILYSYPSSAPFYCKMSLTFPTTIWTYAVLQAHTRKQVSEYHVFTYEWRFVRSPFFDILVCTSLYILSKSADRQSLSSMFFSS